MFRRVRQWLADAELGAIARDLDRVTDTLATATSRLELLEGRFQRVQNRIQMRQARAEQQGDRDLAILADIRRQGGNGGGKQRDFDDSPDW